MHCYCCFSRSGDPLYDQVHLRRPADHRILFFLDCGNNLAEYGAFIFGKVFCQQLVICHHVRVKEIDQPVICDFVGPFPFQVDFTGTFIFYSISAFPYRIFIVDRSDGRPPVYDYRFRSISGNADASDIV